MPLLAAFLLLTAFPDHSVLVDAQAFTVQAHWRPFEREDAHNGTALIANQFDALATLRASLPQRSHTLWVRVYDDATYPGQYAFTLRVNDEERRLGTSEPLFGGFVWERWGTVSGGDLDLAITHAGPFPAFVDLLLFTPDPDFVPSDGARVRMTDVALSGGLPQRSGEIRVRVTPIDPSPRPEEMIVELVRSPRPEKGTARLWSTRFPVPADLVWIPDRGVDLPAVTIPAQAGLWPGRYAVRVGLSGTRMRTGHESAHFNVEEETMPEPCSVKVEDRNGSCTLVINGEEVFPYAFLMHTGDFSRQYRLQGESGVKVISISSGPFDDAPYLQVLRSHPDALIFPRVGVTAPPAWRAAHPDECVLFDDGTRGPQSMFSELWLDEQCGIIEDYCRYLRQSPYADHVIGIHICSGESAEWQSWGLWDDRRGDFSEAARRAWLRYLTGRYGDDEALSAAWGRQVTLAAAPLPSRERREQESGLLRDPGEYRDVMDFYDFYWRGTARAIEQLAAAAKRGGGRDFLVGYFYGYAIQYGGKMQESQHLGMRQVISCPDIDFFCSPAMYSMRQFGGTSTFMSVTESIQQIHGKLWWDEADLRTHLASETPLRTVTDPWESCQIMEREFAHVWTRGAGLWWFDMEGGWFDDPAILELITAQVQFTQRDSVPDWSPAPEVAVLLDDRSSYRMPPESPYLHSAITQFLAKLPTLGTPYSTYLLADLDAVPAHRMYLFPLAFDLTDEIRAAIQALKRGGNTLVFWGPAGTGQWVDNRLKVSEGLQHELLGFSPEGDGIQTREFEGWRCVWVPARELEIETARELSAEAGVHLYSRTNDALYAGRGLISLHAAEAGEKSLSFRSRVRIREVFADAEPLGATGTEIRFPLRKGETRTFEIVQP